MKFTLVVIGILCIGLAVLGIIMPGLPATPFLLLASAAFMKSSPRLYKWLIGHNIFGPILNDFAEKKGISVKIKVISLFLMWLMIGISINWFIDNLTLKWIVAGSGLLGTLVIILIKTVRK